MDALSIVTNFFIPDIDHLRMDTSSNRAHASRVLRTTVDWNRFFFHMTIASAIVVSALGILALAAFFCFFVALVYTDYLINKIKSVVTANLTSYLTTESAPTSAITETLQRMEDFGPSLLGHNTWGGIIGPNSRIIGTNIETIL